MKAITICQPYADLVLLPDSHPDHKRAENRKWYSDYRGQLLIHAGKSRKYLEEDDDRPGHDLYGLKIADMTFGAIIGVVDMIDCLRSDDIRARRLPPSLLWLADHQHVEGPFCHIYANVRRFDTPIPCQGALGLFNVLETRALRHELEKASTPIF